MQNLSILEKLASQHRPDINRPVQRCRAAASIRPTLRNLISDWLAKEGLKRRWALFVGRNRSEASLGLTPRRLQNRRVGW
jgi:hypothetical protein